MAAPLSDRLQPLTTIILCTLLETGTVALAGLAGSVRHGRWALQDVRRFTRPNLHNALSKLRLQHLVRYDALDYEKPIILTKRGFARANKDAIRWSFARRCRLQRWDHLWRVVVFDIPARRKIRHVFRHELRTMGFFRLQYSVYVHPHECGKEIKEICEWHGLQQNTIVFTVTHLGAKEKAVRRFFFSR